MNNHSGLFVQNARYEPATMPNPPRSVRLRRWWSVPRLVTESIVAIFFVIIGIDLLLMTWRTAVSPDAAMWDDRLRRIGQFLLSIVFCAATFWYLGCWCVEVIREFRLVKWGRASVGTIVEKNTFGSIRKRQYQLVFQTDSELQSMRVTRKDFEAASIGEHVTVLDNSSSQSKGVIYE